MQQDIDILEAAERAVRNGLAGTAEAELAIVGGSGLAVLGMLGRELGAMQFSEIPGLGGAGVAGHAGRWILAEAGGRRFHCLLGRRHLYEGIEPGTETLAVRVLARLGVRNVILTNAAGGLGPGLRGGDLMLIRDHLNLMNAECGMRNAESRIQNPELRIQNPVYDRRLCERLARAAGAEGIELKEGVYAALSGPCYETRAEAAMLRAMGADAVGMSTVPEARAAARAGLGVAGVSIITNSHWHKAGPASHDEVLESAAKSGERLKRVLARFVQSL